MSASGGLDNPAISVVISAYRRHDHILDAVESVLDSDVDRHRYEILLVADALPAELNRKLVGLGVHVYHSDTPFVGETLATGLFRARGDVVAFLDDDDCFHKEKLRILLEEFSNPDVLFYHHGFRRVRANREPYPVRSEIAPIREQFALPLSRRNAGRVRRLGGYYNASSIAVRRRFLLPQLAAMRRLTNAPDFSMLLLLGGPGRAVLDGTRVLVDYRSHASMGRHNFYDNLLPPEHIRYLEGTVRSFEAIRESVLTSGARGFADCRLDSYETLLWTTTGRIVSKDSGMKRRALRAIGGNLGERDLLSAVVLSSLLTLSAVSRAWARWLYIHLVRFENSGLGIPSGGASLTSMGLPTGGPSATLGQR